jgi:NAD(P)-dependent dehydrogenase (short-subunit alcohol dehydrogenase family)
MGVLQNRMAIVTGAASGIGAASVAALTREGAQVLAVDRPGARWPDGDGGALRLEADVADPGAGDRIVAAALAAFGRLDIVFSNAGIAAATPIAEMNDADWARVQDVNLTAAFRLARAAAAHLTASPAGRFIATASVMAKGTDFGLGAYCASKAGLEGLVRTLALELGKHGVTANCILPGAIRTGMTSGLWDARPDVAAIWAKKSVLRRLGRPEDIAEVAVFLASDAAGFITGQSIAVDGGMTLRI